MSVPQQLLLHLHFRQHRVSSRVGEEELEAVGRHLHVGWEDEHHGPLVHVPLGEATSDVAPWWDERTQQLSTDTTDTRLLAALDLGSCSQPERNSSELLSGPVRLFSRYPE